MHHLVPHSEGSSRMSNKYKRAHPVRCTFSDNIGITLTVTNTNGEGDESQVITTLTPTEAKELMGNLSLFLDHVSRENVKRQATNRAESTTTVVSKQLTVVNAETKKHQNWNAAAGKWEDDIESCCEVDKFLQVVAAEEPPVHGIGPVPVSGW